MLRLCNITEPGVVLGNSKASNQLHLEVYTLPQVNMETPKGPYVVESGLCKRNYKQFFRLQQGFRSCFRG